MGPSQTDQVKPGRDTEESGADFLKEIMLNR
jgi:hypothetical protein